MNSRVLMIAGLAALWAVALYGLFTLPPTVPSGWGVDGSVRYGSKFDLLILPIIGLAAYFVIGWSLNRPEIGMNLPFEIPPERFDAAQAVGRQFIVFFGAVLMIGFASIETVIVSSAATGKLSPAFAYVIGGVVVTFIGTVVTMMAKIWHVARGSDGA